MNENEDTAVPGIDDLEDVLAVENQSPPLSFAVNESNEVVRYERYINGELVMTWTYYFEPNWYERLHWRLSGYKAVWSE